MDERYYWLGFSVFPGIGPHKFSLLLKTFGTAKTVWNTPQEGLKQILGPTTSERFEQFRNHFSIEKYLSQLEHKKVSFITISDKNYPKLLKQIHNPPFVLYYKGNVALLVSSFSRMRESDPHFYEDDPQKREIASSLSAPRNDRSSIAVVGARKVTSYGMQVTELFTQQLVHSGFTIVSGLALGVDAVAHQTTLENGGNTIAVLGCGVDCCTPRENQNIYNQIIEKGGIIVSEYPLGAPPTIGSFPSRNRIIAGLSQAVVVTEGAEDSGSLITADYAFKFDRPVFAVPGPITSAMSKGPYKLIAKGATLVISAEDIIKELGIMNYPSTVLRTRELRKGTTRKMVGETKEEQRIIALLQNESLSFDELVKQTKLDSKIVGSILSMLEIKGIIENSPDGTIQLKSTTDF